MRPGITVGHSEIKGVRVRWAEAGAHAGPPIVLVHGWRASIIKWLDIMPLLAEHRRVIALDLPGFGASDAPRGSYSPGWLAGALKAFLDGEQIDRAIIAGNSLGGLVGAHFASAFPARTEAYIGICAALPNDGPPPPLASIAQYLTPTVPGVGERMFARMMLDDPEKVVGEGLARTCVDPARIRRETVEALKQEVQERRNRPDYARAVARSNRHLMWALTGKREITWRMLRGLTVPVLYLWGEKDRLVPLRVGHRAVHETPAAHLVVIDDCGHNPQMECPEETAAAMVAFVRASAARSQQRDTSAWRGNPAPCD